MVSVKSARRKGNKRENKGAWAHETKRSFITILHTVVMLLTAEYGLVNVWDDAHHPRHAADTETGWRRPAGQLPGNFRNYTDQQKQQSSRSVPTAHPRLVQRLWFETVILVRTR